VNVGEDVIYLDTSVVVALLTPEEASDHALLWFANSHEVLISSDWLITETHSALGMKRRLAGLPEKAWRTALQQFERLLLDGLELHGLDRARFRDAAELLQESSLGLRAGDALHLAVALHSPCTKLATLDRRLQKAGVALGLKPALVIADQNRNDTLP